MQPLAEALDEIGYVYRWQGSDDRMYMKADTEVGRHREGSSEDTGEPAIG